jgi:hypothetical protein
LQRVEEFSLSTLAEFCGLDQLQERRLLRRCRPTLDGDFGDPGHARGHADVERR